VNWETKLKGKVDWIHTDNKLFVNKIQLNTNGNRVEIIQKMYIKIQKIYIKNDDRK
jgi:hypothetical protein